LTVTAWPFAGPQQESTAQQQATATSDLSPTGVFISGVLSVSRGTEHTITEAGWDFPSKPFASCRQQNSGLATNYANYAKERDRFTGDNKKRPGRENSKE
jgi:hypothetical protein